MFSFTSINQYQASLQNGSISCESAVKYYLNNIEHNKHLNAFTEVYAEEAIQRALQLDDKRKSGNSLGLLHGVVIALKDVICYKGHSVTAASHILKGYEAVYNATAVQRLLDEDAIIIGQCNCDEFAMGSTNENSVYGKVLNELDNTKVPGGSSGGSAVAVQANLCMVSLGSDTGGSVRQPADFCGIIGLKPTYGRISRYGLIAYASSFDQIGFFGKTIADLSLILSVIAGEDDFDSTAIAGKLSHSDYYSPASVERDSKKYRFAYFKEALEHPSLDKEIAHSLKNTLNELRKEGHEVSTVDFEYLDYIVPAYYVLTTAEASSNLSRFDGIRFGHQSKEKITDLTDFYERNRTEGFGKEVQRRILLGTFVLSTGYYDAYFSKAQQVRRLLVDTTNSIFERFDAIILPTSPTTAFPIGEKMTDPIAMYLADIYTVFANLTGIPGVSLPLYKHSNGMPFGLQLMTKKEEEKTLLEISEMLINEYGTYQPN